MENTLTKRAFKFASDTLLFLRKIPYSKENDIIKAQLLRAATSVGANYEEAQGAFSRNDFKYKVCICLREMNEANYWLRLMKNTDISSKEDISNLIQESYELRKIFATILKKLNPRKT